MIKAIVLLIFLTPLVIMGLWVDSYISMIEFAIMDQQISVHPLLLIFAIIVFYLLISLIMRILSSFMRLPKIVTAIFATKRIQNAKPLNDLILAIKNCDIKVAEKLLKKLKAFYDEKIITDLLEAKIYELKGEAKEAIKIYTTYISRTEISRYVTFKIAKLNFWQGNIQSAYENLKTLIPNSDSKETLRLFVITGLKLHKHNEIIAALEDKKAAQTFGDETINQILSYIYSQKAVLCYQDGIYNDALELSHIANDIRPDFVSAEMEILSAIKLGEIKRAMKLLIKHFHLIDSIKLYSFISVLNRYESPKNVYSFFKALNESQNTKAMIVLAKCAIDWAQYDEANKYIARALDDEISVANLLMAEYCLRTHGNASEAFMWFERFTTQTDYISASEFQQIQQEIYNILYERNSQA